jgi:cobalt/nickel transport system permease protein
MNLFQIDKHSDLDSPVHRQDPLVKLLSFVVLVVVVVLMPKGAFVPLLTAAVTLLCVALVSRVPLGFLLRRTLVVVPFVLLIGAVNLVGRGLDLVPARQLSSAGPGWAGASPVATAGGGSAPLVSFGTMAAKSLISVFSFGLLLSTTGSTKLLGAARRLGLPALLTVATGFMLRYVFVLAEELSRLRRSWDARRVGRLHWPAELRSIGSLIGVLWVKSFERAERVYLAMCSRGFDGFVSAQAHDPLALTDAVFPLLLLGPVVVAALVWR